MQASQESDLGVAPAPMDEIFGLFPISATSAPLPPPPPSRGERGLGDSLDPEEPVSRESGLLSSPNQGWEKGPVGEPKIVKFTITSLFCLTWFYFSVS